MTTEKLSERMKHNPKLSVALYADEVEALEQERDTLKEQLEREKKDYYKIMEANRKLLKKTEVAEAEVKTLRNFLNALCGHLIREIMPIRKKYKAESLKGLSRHNCWEVGRGEGLKHALITISNEHPEVVTGLGHYADAVTLDPEKVKYPPFDTSKENWLNQLEDKLEKTQGVLKEDYPCYPTGCDKCKDPGDYPHIPYKDYCFGYKLGEALKGGE